MKTLREIFAELQAELGKCQRERAELAGRVAFGLSPELEHMRELVRSIEWSGERFEGMDETPCCPECFETRPDGHTKGCRIGKVVAGEWLGAEPLMIDPVGVVRALKTGACWCPGGKPDRGEHSQPCRDAQALIASLGPDRVFTVPEVAGSIYLGESAEADLDRALAHVKEKGKPGGF